MCVCVGGVELAVIASANAHGSSDLRSCEKVEVAVMGGGGRGSVEPWSTNDFRLNGQIQVWWCFRRVSSEAPYSLGG